MGKEKRNRFIKILFPLIVFSVSTIAYSHYIEPEQLTQKEVTMEFAEPNTEKRELTILFFSDTHIGQFYNEENLDRIVDKINAASPDLVLFAGDLIDSYYRDKPDLTMISDSLSRITARYGKYAVYGNHDYGGGAVKIYETTMQKGGFQVLTNSSVFLEEAGFSLLGLDNTLLGNPDLNLLSEHKQNGFKIVLSHEPDTALKLKSDRQTLFLSGHTHGGQIGLPILRRLALPRAGREFIKGEYTLPSGAKIFVSSGIGTTQAKLRLLNPPEIVRIRLSIPR